MKLIHRQLVVVVLLVLYFAVACQSSDSVKFNISAEMIKSAWAYNVSQGHSNVNVLLKDEYKRHLSELTENNIGKRLTISFSGKALTTARISSKISSGVVNVGNNLTDEEANSLIVRLGSVNSTIAENKALNNYEESADIIQQQLRSVIEDVSKFEAVGDKAVLSKALNKAEAVVQKFPNSCDAYYWKAMVLTKLGEYKRASGSLTEAVNRKCDGIAKRLGSFLFFRGVIEHKAKMQKKAYEDYEMAIHSYQEILETNPKNIDSIIGMCQALSMMDRKKDALELIKNKISEYPEDQMLKKAQKFIQEFDAATYLEHI
jgi:tetratricopeptide (TPR) repeat protein